MFPRTIVFALVVASSIQGACSEVIVHPERYQLSGGFQTYHEQHPSCFLLSPSNPVVTLDYGTEVGGFPFFGVQSLSAPVQIEARYSESQGGLEHPFADGPWVFSNGLSNTFRVETFNITTPSRVESFFLQGGLRWQTLRLLNGDRSVRVCKAAIRSLNDRTAVDALPGYFECSNELYNKIWALGPRTVQQACIAKGAAPSTWEVTSDGVFLRGQQSAQSVFGTSSANYTMSFSTKIVRGGTGWRVANGIAGFGPSFLLTSEYPTHSTFLNTNRTLVPPNTLAVAYGWNLVNQTSLTSGRVSYYPLSFDVKEGEWIQISTSINVSGYTIKVNDNAPIIVALDALQLVSDALFASADVYTGTWGFGPYQDQLAYVKDVVVHAQNGTLLYENPMTDLSVLEDYGAMDSKHSLCLDGAKRDRLVWSGDFIHTQRIISASTYRNDFVQGSLSYLFERQETDAPFAGIFAMSPSMGQAARYHSTYKSYGLIDYQMFLLNSFARYYLDTGDDTFVQEYWPRVKTGTETLLQLVDPASGLVSANIPGIFFLGSSNGTAPSALLIYTLNSMAQVAEAIGETSTASTWRNTASEISTALNAQLWNDHLGTYSASLTSSEEISLAATAWAILSEAANATQATSAIQALSSLRLGIGYKPSSTVSDSDPSTNLSPNLSGFLLEALFSHARRQGVSDKGTSVAIDTLLNGLWAAMITQDEYYTGTAWEYVYPDGRPGLDLYTSHAHPWGAAPTYVLTEYALGIQSTAIGFSEWSFRPTIVNTGLDWAKGRVPTPHGLIRASWELSGSSSSRNGKENKKDKLSMKVCGPAGTTGYISVPFAADSCQVSSGGGKGKKRYDCSKDGVRVQVEGGECYRVVVFLSDTL